MQLQWLCTNLRFSAFVAGTPPKAISRVCEHLLLHYTQSCSVCAEHFQASDVGYGQRQCSARPKKRSQSAPSDTWMKLARLGLIRFDSFDWTGGTSWNMLERRRCSQQHRCKDGPLEYHGNHGSRRRSRNLFEHVESQLMSVASIARFAKEIVASFCEARAALS